MSTTDRPTRLATIGADARGHITIWDRVAHDYVGYRPEQVLGRNVEMLVPPEYRDRHRAGFTAAMAGGPRSADAAPFHLPVLLKDGSIEVFAVRFIFLDDPAGRPAGAMILLQRAEGEAEAWTPVLAYDAAATRSGGSESGPT